MKRYLFGWLGLTAALVLLVAVFNAVVDPYGLIRGVDRAGFNRIKPAAGAHGSMAKAYQVLRVQPGALILGNSRAEVGFDPQHPAWPAAAQPVFNLALPGTDTSTSVQSLQHVLASPGAHPKVVVWGVDFMDFLVDPRTPPSSPAGAGSGGRWLTQGDGAANPTRWRHQLRDYAESTLTMGALLDSAQTLASQRNAYASDLTPQGFNPMQDYVKISADEGYWNVFRQKDVANLQAYLRRPKSILDAGGRSSYALEDLRRVIQLCQQNGIELHLVVYPYHAHLLQIMRLSGHWPVFEDWKRALVRTVEQASAPGQLVPLWDFSGFNRYANEDIPPRGDRKSQMQWYWEAGHFKSALGGLVLDRVLGHGTPDLAWGVQMQPVNLEAHIATLQAQERDYRLSHAADVQALEALASQAKQRLPSR
ncbi:MAG: hypothetical protein NTZ15_14135 [Burkholderiales bacterium]|nr:hypothetical protein [Burkholderiales bacterium]